MHRLTAPLLAAWLLVGLAVVSTGCGQDRDAGSEARRDASTSGADAGARAPDAARAPRGDAAAPAEAGPAPVADGGAADAAGARADAGDARAATPSPDGGAKAPQPGETAKVAPGQPADAGPAKVPPVAKTVDAGQVAVEAGGGGSGPEPTELTSLLQKVYRDVDSFEADFEQTYRNRLLDRTRESSGHVWLRPPSKMRWEYDPPSKNLIVADGRHLFVFEPEPNQVVKMPVSGSELPSVMAFLTGGRSLSEDYSVVEVHREKMAPQGLAGLELHPRNPSTVVSRVVLVVNRESGQVQRTVLVEPEGNTNTFVWSKVATSVTIPDSRFSFTPPAGARLVER